MSTTERAYLSVFEWPRAFGEEERAGALVSAVGMDPHQARLIARAGVPLVAALLGVGERAAALERLRGLGVVAVAPTREELGRVPQPVAAKRLVEAVGSNGDLYLVEPWRGESEGLRARDIRLLVRASLRVSETRVRATGDAGRAAAQGFMIDGAAGVGAGAMSEGGSVERSTRARVSEVLDIYTSDKRRIRANGDKFGFECLGAERAYGDKANMNALAVKLAERSPSAYIDLGFSAFRPPADLRGRGGRGTGDGAARSRNDSLAFDFYSPWFAVGYAALLKSARA